MKIVQISRMPQEEVLKRLLYRDGLILVFNKPSGIAVHAPGTFGHNLEQYFHWLQFGLPHPPVLAHRLDRGTSGCLVLTRHRKASAKLHNLFSKGLVKKTYVAWVRGVVPLDRGRLDMPLKRCSSEKNDWRMQTDPGGPLAALTEFEVCKRTSEYSLLRLIPLTGRTHQLRVHCAHLGYPILGDVTYGGEQEAGLPLCLHAYSIEIPLYAKKPPLRICAPLPPHMRTHGAEEFFSCP